MYQRALTIPQDKSFFLFGPRGTGKTTWVKNNFPSALYIDLLEAEIYNELLVNPQRLEKMIGNAGAQWIIIDEIQRIPALLHDVHRLIEAKKYRIQDHTADWPVGQTGRNRRKRTRNSCLPGIEQPEQKYES